VTKRTEKGAIFISGGTSGLGLQLTRHFVKKGRNVTFCSRSRESIKAIEVELREHADPNQFITGFECDVSSSESVQEMFLEINDYEINVEVLICNAGEIGPIDKFLETDPKSWEDSFNINLYGTLNLIRVFLPRMVTNQFGRVIHISGGGATNPLFGMTSYAASKAAAVRFVETLSLEYFSTGVTFNSVAPGILKTKLLDQMLEAGSSRIGEKLFQKSSIKAQSDIDTSSKAIDLIDFLAMESTLGITGKLISAEWDNWAEWSNHSKVLQESDLFTLRRVTGRDRGENWGDL
jgi:NAD(P)-dependent dehydrogenase (short-subunit alcohol dehydrogenase family)